MSQPATYKLGVPFKVFIQLFLLNAGYFLKNAAENSNSVSTQHLEKKKEKQLSEFVTKNGEIEYVYKFRFPNVSMTFLLINRVVILIASSTFPCGNLISFLANR